MLRCGEVVCEILGTLFATICHYLPLFETVHHYSHYSGLFALFVLFAIRYSGFPDTQSMSLRSVTTTSCSGDHLRTQLQIATKITEPRIELEFLYIDHSYFFVVDPPTFLVTCCCELTGRWSVRGIKIPAHSMVRWFSWYTLPHCWHRYGQIKQQSESNGCNCIPFLLHCFSISQHDILPWTIRQGFKETDLDFRTFYCFVLFTYFYNNQYRNTETQITINGN